MGEFLALGGRNLDDNGGAHYWRDWGDLIAHLARSPLPYLDLDLPILDTTYGRGVFWSRCQPADLTRNDVDLERDVEHRWDWLRAEPPPEWVGRFHTVIYDPPFKLSGTNRIMLDRYGLDDNAGNKTRGDALLTGAANVAQCVKPGGYLLVKCQAQVAGGRVRWQPRRVANLLEDLGWEIVDELVNQYRPIPQPGNRRQLHARRNYSVATIAQRPKEHRLNELSIPN